MGDLTSYCHKLDLLQQGAEAKIYRTAINGRPTIAKERFKKKYRLPQIDEKLTKRRVQQEIRSLQRCRKAGIYTPSIYLVDTQRSIIFMEEILGETVKNFIRLKQKDNISKLNPMAIVIGRTLAKMHDADVIHGDLTTSNMILKSNEELDSDAFELYLIDFGLGYSCAMAEDKGVDLYVLERAFLSTHPGTEEVFSVLLDSYKSSSKNPNSVINKLDEVRLRGRKRTMVG